MAAPLFASLPRRDVFVLAGDGPLIRPQTLDRLLHVHRDADAAATLATALLDDPTGYGRIIRDEGGAFEAIIEHRDATEEQLQINEINPSYYCFASDKLFDGLARVGNDNRQGEFYLTDVPAVLKGGGDTVCVVDAVPTEDVLSINTPQQLAEVDAILRRRLDSTPGTMRKRA
jgi:bifunctional UDP-N-acetylglucosamine pyrophosphorylase/glucosamine-1-phosphate N-acetyltransferase